MWYNMIRVGFPTPYINHKNKFRREMTSQGTKQLSDLDEKKKSKS